MVVTKVEWCVSIQDPLELDDQGGLELPQQFERRGLKFFFKEIFFETRKKFVSKKQIFFFFEFILQVARDEKCKRNI